MQVQNNTNVQGMHWGVSMPAPRSLMAPPPNKPQHRAPQKRGEGKGQEECMGVGEIYCCCAEAGEQSQQQHSVRRMGRSRRSSSPSSSRCAGDAELDMDEPRMSRRSLQHG
eukprot:1157296-Pelagomonas_calceolata.AAC.14